MTRNGKIARLPFAVREELNHRLQDGHKGRQLVVWLNGRPEVQAVLAAEFLGQPIKECNLSRWKNGGYRTWMEAQNTRETALAMIEDSPALRTAGQDGLSESMACLLAARMALEIKRMDDMPEGARKSKMFRQVFKLFATLRRGGLQTEKLRLQSERICLQRRLNQTERADASSRIADANPASRADNPALSPPR